MMNVAKLEKEEFEKNFICPAEQIWLEQGIEKGIEKNTASTALKMLKEKLSIKLVSKITGLSVLQIQQLKEKTKKH